jgi:hypothetical protein
VAAEGETVAVSVMAVPTVVVVAEAANVVVVAVVDVEPETVVPPEPHPLSESALMRKANMLMEWSKFSRIL